MLANWKAVSLTAITGALTTLGPHLFGFPYLSLQWFAFFGMTLVAISRFHNVRQGLPCPELLYYLACSYLPGLYFSHFLNSSRTPSADELLWQFDRALGRPEVPLTAFFMNHHIANAIILVAYLSLPLSAVILYLLLPNVAAVRRKYCIACGLGSVAPLFYRVCPAAGPAYVFPRSFPYSVPLLTHPQFRIIPNVGLNCAPSGHLAWALIMLWFARRYCGKRVQAGAAAFVALTCLGTLGLGEHYGIDLVLGVPFAAGLLMIADGEWIRAAIDWAVLLVWLVALDSGLALKLPAYGVWALSLVTLLAPLKLSAGSAWNRLRKASRDAPKFALEPVASAN